MDLFLAAVLVSSIGFKKYVWFISIGYGFSAAAIGVVLLWRCKSDLTLGTAAACVLFIIHVCRLGELATPDEIRTPTFLG